MGAGDLLRRLDQRVLPPMGRALHRLGRGAGRMRLLTIAAVVSTLAVLLAALWAADRRPTSDPTIGQVVRVGVVEGQSIPAYVSASRDELAALVAAPGTGTAPVETYALVTLAAYLAPDRLTPVLGGLAVTQVFARVPLPETQTEIVRIPAFRVPGDVAAGMVHVAERKADEAAEYERLAGQLTGDGDKERQLRAVYSSGALVASAEATAYREHCSCVYAAVVRATPAVLERVAARHEVRAVDPAPEVRRIDRAVFLPPLPEQDDIAKPPPDGVLASPSPLPPRQDDTAPVPSASAPEPVPSEPVPSASEPGPGPTASSGSG